MHNTCTLWQGHAPSYRDGPVGMVSRVHAAALRPRRAVHDLVCLQVA
jgi:hypothetical protein